MRADRAAAGLSGAAILVVIALSPEGIFVMEPILLVAAGLVVLGTFAPVLPVLHRLPIVGAPTVKLRLTIGGRDDLVVPDGSSTTKLRIGICNEGSSELERARLSVLVPDTVTIFPVDAYFGTHESRGTRMPPTSERLLPGMDSNWWFERHNLDPDWTMLHYRVGFPGPGAYPIRIKLVSKSMYRPIEVDYEIRVLGAG
jgi:hypothetical protein